MSAMMASVLMQRRPQPPEADAEELHEAGCTEKEYQSGTQLKGGHEPSEVARSSRVGAGQLHEGPDIVHRQGRLEILGYLGPRLDPRDPGDGLERSGIAEGVRLEGAIDGGLDRRPEPLAPCDLRRDPS